MDKIPNRAKAFIGVIALTASAIALHAVLRMHPWHHYQTFILLAIAVLASRLKLKLPGLNGNMSVNLPFVLIAVVQLSLPEALLIAGASTAAQCFPKGGGKPKLVQMLFNVSTMAIAVGLGGWILRSTSLSRLPWTSTSLLTSLAAAGFFLAQTVPVATVISLTEGGRALRIWSSIVHLSFPYYVLSAGVTSLVTSAAHRIGWQISVLVLPMMVGVYRSYQVYFVRTDPTPQSMASAKSASC